MDLATIGITVVSPRVDVVAQQHAVGPMGSIQPGEVTFVSACHEHVVGSPFRWNHD